MTGLLVRFEAIESRIVSSSCPKGIAGRVHSIRLRRCFHNTNRWQQSTAQNTSISARDSHEGVAGGDIQKSGGQVLGNARDLPGVGHSHTFQRHAGESALHVEGLTQLTDGSDEPPAVDKEQALRQLDGYGDVLPIEFLGGAPRDFPIQDDTALKHALKNARPHQVLKALANLIYRDGARYTSNYLASLPSTTFSEILRCLDPKHFVNRHVELHMEISESQARRLSIPGVDESGYMKFLSIFLNQVSRIIEVRAQQHPLSLSDFKYLLKCARATGNTTVAQSVWKSITWKSRNNSETTIKLDAECYNHYLATKCWSDTLNHCRRDKLRVLPSRMWLRSWSAPPWRFDGYSVGPERGIKAQTAHIFRSMVESGISGNEETFCLMIVAMGREGDISAASNILKRVWDVDVDRILTEDESGVPPPRAYNRDSPFYPSEQLLFTIAHVWGNNNNIPAALRLIDYISRHYDVAIPIKVWNELLQWTYVISKRRNNKETEMNPAEQKLGQLPPPATMSLWQTMTSKPYNVKPTLQMYSRLILNLFSRERFLEAEKFMVQAFKASYSNLRDFQFAEKMYNSTPTTHPLAPQRARDLYYTRLRVQRNQLYFRNWVDRYITLGCRSLRHHRPQFTSQTVPNILKMWEQFLPPVVTYKVAQGEVKLQTTVVPGAPWVNRHVGLSTSARFLSDNYRPKRYVVRRRYAKGGNAALLRRRNKWHEF